MIPEVKRKLHEPETSTIQERVEAINKFKEAGYEVHINFSPIIDKITIMFFPYIYYKNTFIHFKCIII